MGVGIPYLYDSVPKIAQPSDHLVVRAVDQSYIFPPASKGDRLLNLLKGNPAPEKLGCELLICGCESAIDTSALQ